MMKYSDLAYLAAKLPEDIMKLKWGGDFERALRLIDLRLEKDIPEALRKRLVLEKDILRRMPGYYPYTCDQAFAEYEKAVEGGTREELESLIDEGAIDWIYVRGEMHVKADFISNLVKTRSSIADRLKDEAGLDRRNKKNHLLDDTIKKMKEQGKVSYLFHIHSRLQVKPDAERPGELIQVHLPLPLEYAQIEHVEVLSASPDPVRVGDKEYPQRTVCFEGVLLEGQQFQLDYSFENHAKYVELRAEEVLDAQPAFYTEEQLPHVRFTPYMKELVKEVVGTEQNPLLKARKIYDYITTHLMYSFVRSYFTITDIPTYAATGWKGDCGVQALLFITMCRCAGVPARWQAGLYCPLDDVGNHDWAQFYVAPYGWLYADCSFGGGAYRAGNMERWNFYFGNLDPFRIPANSDFQVPLYPSKKHLRHDPYDNQSGEAEYRDRALEGNEYDVVYEIMKAEEL